MPLALLLVLACASRPTPPAPADVPFDQRTDVKRPGNLPVRTEAELAAADTARSSCLDACRSGEEAAEDDAGAARQACEAACLQAHPIEQVEVIPSPPSPGQ